MPECIAAFEGARFAFFDDIPEDLRVGLRPARQELDAWVRFSNAASSRPAGYREGLPRSGGPYLRFATTNSTICWPPTSPSPHARDAQQFVYFAHALSGGTLSRIGGPRSASRCRLRSGGDDADARQRRAGDAVPRSRLALESYWSRGAIKLGRRSCPLRLPSRARRAAGADQVDEAGRLAAEFEERLREASPLRLLCPTLRRRRATPIEDAAHAWDETASPPVTSPRSSAAARPDRRPRRSPSAGRSTMPASTRGTRPTTSARSATSTARARASTTPPPHTVSCEALAARSAAAAATGCSGRHRWTLPAALNRSRPWHRMPLLFSLLISTRCGTTCGPGT